MIKVALLIDEFFGGAGTAFGGYGFLARSYICKYIPDKNIQIDVLLERKSGLTTVESEKVDNVNVYRLPENETLAKTWLKEQNYNLYLSIEMTYPSYEIMKLVDDKKLILWIQDPRPDEMWQEKRNSVSLIKDPCVTDKKIPALIKRLVLENRVKFISQGDSLNPRAVQLYDLPEKYPIQYLPNPIDIDFSYKFDISQKKKQVIFLGRLEAQKRAWLVCEIAKLLPEYDFYIMGKFFRDEEVNKKVLEPYMNVDIKNLHFTGHLEGKEKEKLIKESRLLINTSIWEGIPISWLEALQYGTLIVSCLDNENLPSKFGNYVGEILGDGYEQTSKFVPAIKELMENDDLYVSKALNAFKYARKYHTVEKFVRSLRKLIIKFNNAKIKPTTLKIIPTPRCVRETIHHIDVKISYACNFKCEYCYQVDDNGNRFKGFFEHKNVDNLIKFIDRLHAKCRVNLVGGEPFIYPYLNELAEKLVSKGHLPNMITNFSAPFEKIQTFLDIVKNNLRGFSISIHISQWSNINDLYEKLEKLINYKKKQGYEWEIWLSCVITEANFDKAIEVGNYIKENYGLNITYQRVYYKGVYNIYSDRIEQYFKEHKLDVDEDKANHIDFWGRYCWAGSKFFYIEFNGDVHRCYTRQVKNDILGNLSNYKKIKISDYPTPCLSADNGNCVCFKHFVGSKFLTEYSANDNVVQTYLHPINRKNHLKYAGYRFLSNFTMGKVKQKILNKKRKYKELIDEE